MNEIQVDTYENGYRGGHSSYVIVQLHDLLNPGLGFTGNLSESLSQASNHTRHEVNTYSGKRGFELSSFRWHRYLFRAGTSL